MDAKQIRFFLEIARTGSFTSAAKKLFISVPGLVKSMDKLEDELGVKLFHRSRHSIILTEEGMLLKRRAQEIVSLSDKTLLELSRKDEIVTGEIAIGGGETKACFFWRNG
mgnify:CR=1 FL=1